MTQGHSKGFCRIDNNIAKPSGAPAYDPIDREKPMGETYKG